MGFQRRGKVGEARVYPSRLSPSFDSTCVRGWVADAFRNPNERHSQRTVLRLIVVLWLPVSDVMVAGQPTPILQASRNNWYCIFARADLNRTAAR